MPVSPLSELLNSLGESPERGLSSICFHLLSLVMNSLTEREPSVGVWKGSLPLFTAIPCSAENRMKHWALWPDLGACVSC